MHVDVTYTLRCTASGCEATDIQSWPQQWLTYGHPLPLPLEPLGWVCIGTLLLCPRHQIMLLVDGQDVAVDAALPF
jgi:hypothetical protein